MSRPTIPQEQKNILATFSINQRQALRLKSVKHKSKLIQMLLNKHFKLMP